MDNIILTYPKTPDAIGSYISKSIFSNKPFSSKILRVSSYECFLLWSLSFLNISIKFLSTKSGLWDIYWKSLMITEPYFKIYTRSLDT